METRQALRSEVFSAQPHYWAQRILLVVKRQFILVRSLRPNNVHKTYSSRFVVECNADNATTLKNTE